MARQNSQIGQSALITDPEFAGGKRNRHGFRRVSRERRDAGHCDAVSLRDEGEIPCAEFDRLAPVNHEETGAFKDSAIERLPGIRSTDVPSPGADDELRVPGDRLEQRNDLRQRINHPGLLQMNFGRRSIGSPVAAVYRLDVANQITPETPHENDPDHRMLLRLWPRNR